MLNEKDSNNLRLYGTATSNIGKLELTRGFPSKNNLMKPLSLALSRSLVPRTRQGNFPIYLGYVIQHSVPGTTHT